MLAHPVDVRAPHLACVRALRAQTCAPPADMHAPHLAGMRALRAQTCAPPSSQTCAPSQACAPSPHGCAPPADVHAPHLAGVHALRAQTCAPPSSQACAPYTHAYTPYTHGCAPPLDVRTPHLAGVHALPSHTCAPLPCMRRRPTPAGVRTFPTPMRGPSQTCAPCRPLCAPCPPKARALIVGGKTRYIRRGPSHPHFTMLGFVSWDSFVGSLHEVVGMVQHFRFLPF
jgi:hypothetical protein